MAVQSQSYGKMDFQGPWDATQEYYLNTGTFDKTPAVVVASSLYVAIGQPVKGTSPASDTTNWYELPGGGTGSVLTTVLTGYVATAGTVSATDTVLAAFENIGASLATTSAQIIVGNGSNIATPVTMSGAVTITNAGVTSLAATSVTGALLTGYSATAGAIAAGDTILQAFNNVGASLATTSAQIIVGNGSNIATPVTMTGAVTISNSGVTSLTATSVTGALLTGYSAAAGTIAAGDSILVGFNKIGGSLATTSAQIIVGSGTGIATPVTMTGAVTISNTGVTSLAAASVSGALLTGYSASAGIVAATDSILTAFNKVCASAVKFRVGGATAPTVTDDVTAGYQVGSPWYDTVTPKFYVCTSNSTGAATWATIV